MVQRDPLQLLLLFGVLHTLQPFVAECTVGTFIQLLLVGEVVELIGNETYFVVAVVAGVAILLHSKGGHETHTDDELFTNSHDSCSLS